MKSWNRYFPWSIGVWDREGLCQLFRSFKKLNLPLIAGSHFFISEVPNPTTLFWKGRFICFYGFFFCNLKASWIIKPVIFQACKCFQHVALFPESAHSVASWKTSVSRNHLRCWHFSLGLLYLGCSFGRKKKSMYFSQSPTLKVMAEILLRVKAIISQFQKKNSRPINIFPWCWTLAYIQPGAKGNSSSPHFMRDNKRVLWVTTEQFFSALKPNVFIRVRGKKCQSQTDENQSKYGLVVADTAILAGPKTQKASSGVAPRHWLNCISVSAAGSCRPAPRISWVYCWKWSDLFCSLPEAEKWPAKRAERLSEASQAAF